MLKTFFNQYKLYVYLALLALYSGAVWYIAAGFTSNSYTKERLAQAQEIIRVNEENKAQLAKVTANFLKALQDNKAENAKLNKELLNELQKSPAYTDCRNTDGVRDLYKRKLETQ